MSETVLTPLEAYRLILDFARRRGEHAFRLAMHVAVPQGFRYDFLPIVRRNFVPEAAADPSVDADLLFSPLCEKLGGGYFRFDEELRRQLLRQLEITHASEPRSRVRQVAALLLAWVEERERTLGVRADRLDREHLALQRWVALGFLDPALAAEQLAEAVADNLSQDAPTAARVRVGSVAAVLSLPLAGRRDLVEYALGVQARADGLPARAAYHLAAAGPGELRVGDVALPPAGSLRLATEDVEPESPEEPAEPAPATPKAVRADVLVAAVESDRSSARVIGTVLTEAGFDVQVRASFGGRASLRIFLSSTVQDLEPERAGVTAALRRLGHRVVVAEDYVAEDASPIDASRSEIDRSDLFLGLVGWRYGYVPSAQNPDGLSVVELEYQHARARGLPCLLFLSADNARPSSAMEAETSESESGRRIERFRSSLVRDHSVWYFHNADELAQLASVSLQRYLDFATDVEGALRAAAIVLVWSRAAARNHAIATLAERAHEAGKLLPALIEEASFPSEFRGVERIDLSGWRANLDDPRVEALRRAVKEMLHRGEAEPLWRRSFAAEPESVQELSPDGRVEYERMFATCRLRPERREKTEVIVQRLLAHRSRYSNLGEPLGIPWWVIGILHALQTDFAFDRHFHNGDPLTGRTVHFPAGRPIEGSPPFTWEQSARDALRLEGLDGQKDWSIAAVLDRLERWNGLGYRMRGVPSAYLWSWTNHYQQGTFVADNVYDPEAIARGPGAAALLRLLIDARWIDVEGANPTNEDFGTSTRRVFRDTLKDGSRGPEMVVIPSGTFVMGSIEAERQWAVDRGAQWDWVQDEQPQHGVRIARPLAVGRFPVTFEEYDHFARITGRDQPGDAGWGRGRRPVINVSWEDAKAYSEWLAAETSQPYRLLSEAEWEYVCRAGTTTRYWWGDEITPENANYGDHLGKTSEVGTYGANPWGLYDTHGNVWEWVEDCWNDRYEGAPEDGRAWTSGDCGRRVLRGGSWSNPNWDLRSANRFAEQLDKWVHDFGFRIARMLSPSESVIP